MANRQLDLISAITEKLSDLNAFELETLLAELSPHSPQELRSERAQFRKTVTLLRSLSESQLEWIHQLATSFTLTHRYTILTPGFVTHCVLQRIGDALLVHHSLSREPFSKDKFEYVLERSLVLWHQGSYCSQG